MTEEELKVKRKEFLDDTVKYYSKDTSRRATEVTSNGSPICSYRTEDGRKCAIGRHIPDEDYNSKIEGGGVNRRVMSYLPQEVTILGENFLSKIQLLHDNSDNWNKKGLSNVGLYTVSIIEGFILNNRY